MVNWVCKKDRSLLIRQKVKIRRAISPAMWNSMHFFMFIEINVFILVTYFCTWNSDKTRAILSYVMILWVRNSGRAQLGDFSILYGVVTHLSVVLWWHMVWRAQDNEMHRSDALTEMAHVSIRVISGSSDLPYGSLRLQAWVFQQPRQELHSLWCLSLRSPSATSSLF